MQLAWSRIWTRVAVSISYDDNHCTTGILVITYLTQQGTVKWNKKMKNKNKKINATRNNNLKQYRGIATEIHYIDYIPPSVVPKQETRTKYTCFSNEGV